MRSRTRDATLAAPEATANTSERGKMYVRKDAARYLTEHYGPTSEASLAKAAVTGDGPPFRKYGRWPLYEERDLDAYGESRLGPLQTSTSDGPNGTKGKGGRRPAEMEAA